MDLLEDTLPVAGQSFAQIRELNMLYIDKTDLVARLARNVGPFFLARPRRFGKSLLLSTFQELFTNGKKSFAGLKLEKDAPWDDDGKYKVILLDLMDIGSQDPKSSFEQDFTDLLEDEFNNVGIPFGEFEDWKRSLKKTLR